MKFTLADGLFSSIVDKERNTSWTDWYFEAFMDMRWVYISFKSNTGIVSGLKNHVHSGVTINALIKQWYMYFFYCLYWYLFLETWIKPVKRFTMKYDHYLD